MTMKQSLLIWGKKNYMHLKTRYLGKYGDRERWGKQAIFDITQSIWWLTGDLVLFKVIKCRGLQYITRHAAHMVKIKKCVYNFSEETIQKLAI
jgi:hypothetical protein